MKKIVFMFLLASIFSFPNAAEARKCSLKKQIDKCASQCRYCTEGNHGAACFAGWWNAWLKPEYREAKWMLSNGSFSRGHKSALMSQVLQGIAAKKGVEVGDLSDDDVVSYGNEVLGSALGTIVKTLDSLGLKNNELKIQCYMWCDQIDPITYRRNYDRKRARAAIQLDDGACATGGPGAWNPDWPKQAKASYVSKTATLPPPAAGSLLSDLAGTYTHYPTKNDWHVGTITVTYRGRTPEIRWTNRANRSWALHLDPHNSNILRTGQDNPYYAQYPHLRVFKILRRNGRVSGFDFGGIYKRQP